MYPKIQLLLIIILLLSKKYYKFHLGLKTQPGRIWRPIRKYNQWAWTLVQAHWTDTNPLHLMQSQPSNQSAETFKSPGPRPSLPHELGFHSPLPSPPLPYQSIPSLVVRHSGGGEYGEGTAGPASQVRGRHTKPTTFFPLGQASIWSDPSSPFCFVSGAGRTCGARSWATSAPSRTSTSTRRCCRSRASAPRRTWRGTAASGSPTCTRPRPRATAPPSDASGARSRARTVTPASSAPSSGPTSRPAPWWAPIAGVFFCFFFLSAFLMGAFNGVAG